MPVYITPGLVDLQVNGFAGVDFNTPGLDAAALDRALRAMLATGVTRCLPTLITAGEDHLAACLAALETSAAGSELGRKMVLGYHLEGPFLSPEPGYCGCHPPEFMRPADLVLFDRLQAAANGRIRLVTVAPEVPGALDLVGALAGRGIIVALGHTAASRETLRDAVARGAKLATHLGNGCARTLPRNDNPVLNQLADDRLAASFIADGTHIPADILKVYLRAKGLERAILVTDAVAGAAASPGDYRLGPVAITRRAEPVVHVSGTTDLAGSALTLDTAVRNVMTWLGLDLAAAVRLASENPLRLLGLAPGADRAWWRPSDTGPTVDRAIP